MVLRIFLLAAVASLHAQTAKVIQLSEVDSQQARKTRDDLDKAQSAWNVLVTDISNRYISIREEFVNAIEMSASESSFVIGMSALGSSNVHLGHLAHPSPGHCDLTTATIATLQEQVDGCKAWLADKEEVERKEKEAESKLPKTYSYQRKEGWYEGFEFSEDYKFIVPKSTPTSQPNGWTFYPSPNKVLTPSWVQVQ